MFEFVFDNNAMFYIYFDHILVAIVEVDKVAESTDLKYRTGDALLLDLFQRGLHLEGVFVYYIFEQIAMQQTEADKVKYWQYKLQQKKNGEKISQKSKSIKNKTPEKNQKLGYILNSQDNFFSNTLQKFKGFLEQNSLRKKPLNMTCSNKVQKNCQTSRSYQLTDHKQKVKKEQKKQKQNKSKIQNLTKKVKQHTDQKQKNSLTPIKNKSKSRSKSQKHRIDKTKSQIQKIKSKKQLKSSPSNDISKKRSLKTKETTRKFETIILETLEDSQESSWKKKLMDTIIVHKDNSPTINRRQKDFVSHFKIWQEHQQKQFNIQKKSKRIIQKYLQGFVDIMKFENKVKNKKQKLKVDFKQIVKNQQKKLLFLKQQLSSLKNAQNLNQSLNFLIGKVNENISSLQNIQGAVYPRNVSNNSSRMSQIKNDQNIKPDASIQNEQNDRDTNKTVFNQSQNSLSFTQSNWQHQQIKFGRAQKNHIINANQSASQLMGFSSNQKQKSSLSFTVERPSLTLYQQQQSNSLRIDDKFNDITLKPFIDSQQGENQQISSSTEKQESVNNKNQLYLNEFLAQEKSKTKNFVMGGQRQSFKSLEHDLDQTKQIKQIIKNQIKIQDDYQPCNPIFTRSKKCTNLEEIGQIQLEHINNTPKNTLFNIIKIQIDQQQKQIDNEARIQQKNHVFELILAELLSQAAQFCLKHDFKQKFLLLVQYDRKVILQNEVIYQSQQEEIVPQVQNSERYILDLAGKVLKYAYTNNITERLSKPLGMTSLATLRCIRRLHSQQYAEQQENIDQEDEAIQQYSQVIDSHLFQQFQQHFSAHPQNPYQLIFNRCVYDTINYLLDECRPFGSKGMPGICIQSYKYLLPSLNNLTRKITNELQTITKIKMGPVVEGVSESEMQQRINRSLDLWRIDLMKYIEKQYNYRQEDDTIQRCELMMEIQQELLLQQIVNLESFMAKRKSIIDLQ